MIGWRDNGFIEGLVRIEKPVLVLVIVGEAGRYVLARVIDGDCGAVLGDETEEVLVSCWAFELRRNSLLILFPRGVSSIVGCLCSCSATVDALVGGCSAMVDALVTFGLGACSARL